MVYIRFYSLIVHSFAPLFGMDHNSCTLWAKVDQIIKSYFLGISMTQALQLLAYYYHVSILQGKNCSIHLGDHRLYIWKESADCLLKKVFKMAAMISNVT